MRRYTRNRSKPRKQEPWMKDVRKGDVLLTKSGTERTVREVTRYKNGDLACVTFSILHCSWTTRSYTVVNYNDLRQMGYRPAGIRRELRSKMDRLIAKALATKGRAIDQPIHCCDVVGVAR